MLGLSCSNFAQARWRGHVQPHLSTRSRESHDTCRAQADQWRCTQHAVSAVISVVLGASPMSVPALLWPLPSSAAPVDTSVQKAGPAAKIEESDISTEDPKAVVETLRNVVLPKVEAKLSEAAKDDGGLYSDSTIGELKSVKGQIDDILGQVKSGQDASVVKSQASSVEQQLNAIKALLGFD